jgi:hypothetical protein
MWIWSHEIFSGHAGNVGESAHVLHSDRGILEYRISSILDVANAVTGTKEMIVVSSVTIFNADRMWRSNLHSLVSHAVLAHTVVVRITYKLCRVGLWKKNECADRSGHLVSIQHECKSDEMYSAHTTGVTTIKIPVTQNLNATMTTTPK